MARVRSLQSSDVAQNPACMLSDQEFQARDSLLWFPFPYISVCLKGISFHFVSFAVLIARFSQNEGSVSEQYRPSLFLSLSLSLSIFLPSLAVFDLVLPAKSVSHPGKERRHSGVWCSTLPPTEFRKSKGPRFREYSTSIFRS